MELHLLLGYSGTRASIDMERIRAAEDAGYACIWTAEAYGSDAVSTAAWILALTSRIRVGTGIMQMQARTPAMAAMTAMTLHDLSGGRFVLGVGPSGPQVIEGWHGVAYGRPLTRTREYIEIVRKVLAREKPLMHEGYHYRIPNTGEGTTGIGKPLKSIVHGDPSLEIVTGTMTPAGVRLSAEIADGMLLAFMKPERFDVFEEPLNRGFAAAGGGKSLTEFDIIPYVALIVGDDLEACRQPVREQLALYVGGMGHRERNFYADYARSIGYGDAAAEIQDLYLAGKRRDAAAAVPDDLIDDLALVGPAERIAELLGRWREAAARRHISALAVDARTADDVRLLAELAG